MRFNLNVVRGMRRVEKVVRQEEDGGMTEDDEGEETLAGSDKNPEKEASGNGLVWVVAGNGEARAKNSYCRITQPETVTKIEQTMKQCLTSG